MPGGRAAGRRGVHRLVPALLRPGVRPAVGPDRVLPEVPVPAGRRVGVRLIRTTAVAVRTTRPRPRRNSNSTGGSTCAAWHRRRTAPTWSHERVTGPRPDHRHRGMPPPHRQTNSPGTPALPPPTAVRIFSRPGNAARALRRGTVTQAEARPDTARLFALGRGVATRR